MVGYTYKESSRTAALKNRFELPRLRFLGPDGVTFYFIKSYFFLLVIKAIISTMSDANAITHNNPSHVTMIITPSNRAIPSVPSCAEQNSVTTLHSYSITQMFGSQSVLLFLSEISDFESIKSTADQVFFYLLYHAIK